jgi:CO/xanthine dehydrogenase FAD-binding subunit
VKPPPFEYHDPRSLDDALAPESDLHASAEYRRRLARTLLARAVTEAVGRAEGPRR